MSTDAAGRNHQPAGAPVGGQFATGAIPETGTTLARPLDPLVGDLGIEPGDSHFMSAYEAGTDIFNYVEIIRDDKGAYRVSGAMPLDLIDAFHEMARFSDRVTSTGENDRGDFSAGQTDEATAFLNANQQLVASFLADKYGCELDGDEWDYQQAEFTTVLDPAVDTAGSAASRLENATKAVQLYNESDAGTFGSPYVWRELAAHVDQWEDEVTAAEREFAADVFSDHGLRSLDADVKAADSSPAELAASGAGLVRTFMAGRYDQMEQAKREHQELHGTPYESLGRDLSLAIHNPPNTPHGRLAFAAFPPSTQARLQAAARANQA